MLTTDFWHRAQLSKDVLAIIGALNAAAANRTTEHDIKILSDGIAMLASAENGALKIRKPDVSTKWALDTFKFRSAADALAKIKVPQPRPELVQFLQNVQTVLRSLSARQPVDLKDLEIVRTFFHAFEENLIKSLGTAQERAPAQYL